MNELAALVPVNIDFPILTSVFRPMEIMLVLLAIGSAAWPMWFFNKKAWKGHWLVHCPITML